jgi:O-antigen/teichoic acid export membrane protein
MVQAAHAVDAPRAGLLQRIGSLGSAGVLVALATMATNLLSAVVPVITPRLLPAGQVGEVGALVAVGSVVAAVGVGLQTALAVRWARQDTVVRASRVSFLTAGVAMGALLVATPVLALVLNLPAAQTVLLALLTFPVVLASRWLGELQGRQQYGRLAAGVLVLGLGRYGGMLIALLAGLSVTAAVAVGALTAYLGTAAIVRLAGHSLTDIFSAGTGYLRGELPRAGRHSAVDPADTPIHEREVLRAGSATIAMLAISYADLLLAKAVLPADAAGGYSVGGVLTRGAVWAPAVLTVVALPMFAQARRHAVTITLACTALVGVVLAGTSALFGSLAVRLAGGAAYGNLAGYAFGFALVGALYAVAFVLVNAEIAAGTRRPALWLWVAVVGIVVAAVVLRPSTVGGVLLLSVCTAGATTAAVSLAYVLRRRRHHAPAQEPAAVSTSPSGTA